MTLLQLVTNLQGSFNGALTSALSSADSSVVTAVQNACDAVIQWLAHGYADGTMTLLEVASHAARYQAIAKALTSAADAGYVTVLQIASFTANFMAYFG